MLTHEKQQESIHRTVGSLQRNRFFGKLILHFKDGNFILATIDQTALPENLLKDSSILADNGGNKGGN